MRTEALPQASRGARNIYNDFLDLFATNLAQHYHNSALDDLEMFESRRRPPNIKNKADWLNDNLLKVVGHLTQRNATCQKAIEDYSERYVQAMRRRPTFKVSTRRRSHITYSWGMICFLSLVLLCLWKGRNSS